MATACVVSCDICMYDFNEENRKSVTLPCGHDFCLTCLVRLKRSGSHNCPKCRSDWAQLEVVALPGMEEGEGAVGQQREEGGLDKKKKIIKRHDICKKHDLPYKLWCVDDNDFYCLKCVVENSNKKMELIKDAIPLIRSDLNQKVGKKAEQIKLDIDELEIIEEKLNEELIPIREFKDSILRHERSIQQRLSKIGCLKAGRVKASVVVAEIEGRIPKIKWNSDMSLAVESTAILKNLAPALESPVKEDSENLLCNIARVFTMQASPAGPPSEATFIRELLKASGSPVGPLTEVLRAAEELEGGGRWTVDSCSSLAALLALADRQPSDLTLLARPDEVEAFPAAAVAAVTKAARSCQVKARFLDSFLKPEDTSRDLARLEEITKHPSLRTTHFYGHLDRAGIAKLPRSVRWLGLAICSAADGRTVSSLCPWEGLRLLGVSISCSVAVQDLRPLPRVPFTDLYFPGLTDDRVDSVRPAIEALLPGRVVSSLRLPANQLTADGARRLAGLLRGVRISIGVQIEAVGPWRPGSKEKESVEEVFRSAGGCDVQWDMSSLYGS